MKDGLKETLPIKNAARERRVQPQTGPRPCEAPQQRGPSSLTDGLGAQQEDGGTSPEGSSFGT